jgi:hypothetical protein
VKIWISEEATDIRGLDFDQGRRILDFIVNDGIMKFNTSFASSSGTYYPTIVIRKVGGPVSPDDSKVGVVLLSLVLAKKNSCISYLERSGYSLPPADSTWALMSLLYIEIDVNAPPEDVLKRFRILLGVDIPESPVIMPPSLN